MKFIVIGAGLTGFQLAKRLIDGKNDVVLIDNNAESVRQADARLDCMVVQANGNDLGILEKAGIADADAMIAVTDSDEVNMITCSLVDSLYPSVLKIARVRNEEYYPDKEMLGAWKGSRPMYGIDFMVHPDSEVASVICDSVFHGAVNEVLQFEDSDFTLVSVTVGERCPLDGARLQDIRRGSAREFVLCYVENAEVTSIPSGETVLQAGDRVGILAEKESLPELFRLAGFAPVPIRKVAVVGAGRIGTQIAEKLLERKKGRGPGRLFSPFRSLTASAPVVSIIDKNPELAQEASGRFPDVHVFNADVTDEGFVAEEGLADYDLFISVTHNHELNMVTSAYFKALGVRKTVSLVGSATMAAIARSIGSDVAVPIKETVVDCILGHLRGRAVQSVHTFGEEGDLEIVEAVIPEDAPVCGRMLKDVARPGEFLVLLVKKESGYAIPVGDTVLEAGDCVIFIVHGEESGGILQQFGGGKV